MLRLPFRKFAVILNPFTVLGLKDNSNLEEAKAAYKKLVMKYHPDVSKSEDTGEKFREVTEAYSMVKKRIESRENSAIPKEDGFVSKRPKYDGKVGSVLRDDKIREYINFRPLDIVLPHKDRLGLEYKPFFNDQDSTHPKAGTITMILICCLVAGGYSYSFMNLVQKDEDINRLLYEKLKRKYKDKEWDKTKLHPALQVVQNDPEYKEYVKKYKYNQAAAKFMAFNISPAVIDRFNAEDYEQNERSREFAKIES
ncbi:hypothetical protein SteCoe_14078 [Stentor coeruleus]|uniref:J domain-containing protein n=1 Tax=Stentor coeruleus TaxID=5963 RepID=A0A1R2C6X1_9CILI|nr:hypothetical protein SteCoe_14078 [Stentor coeruleus]